MQAVSLMTVKKKEGSPGATSNLSKKKQLFCATFCVYLIDNQLEIYYNIATK